MYKIDIDYLSNGKGKAVYGGSLDAYSFFETSCEQWFGQFTKDVIAAEGKKYYPVYRIADGELRFLFGFKINWTRNSMKSILSYIKYEILRFPWKTSWGEVYDPKELVALKETLRLCISEISRDGILAIYWNENGLNAYTEYNKTLQSLFLNIDIHINQRNYIPFHFAQALVAKKISNLIMDKNVFFVSGLPEDEFINLQKNMEAFGAKNVALYKCSGKSALTEDYTKISPTFSPDIVFVAAGIGAAKVLVDLRHLNCPIIDIGSYIHVLSGKSNEAHAGFFEFPK